MSTRYLRQSTTATILAGPFLDKADGLTPLPSVTDQSANARLAKNGTGAAFTAASWGAHDGNGYYPVGFSTSHTDTVGRLRLSFSLPGTYCPVWEDFEVLSQAAFDALTGVAGWTGVALAADQAVNATKWAGQAIPTPAVTGVPKVDLTDIDGLATNGNNATLNLKQLNVVNNAGDAVVASSTGGGGSGIKASGNSVGHGVSATAGTSGDGVHATGGTNGGHGAYLAAAYSSGVGIFANGGSQGHGLFASGNGTGHGVYADGGTGAGANGFYAHSSSIAGGDGFKAAGSGTGKDLNATTSNLIVASIASFGTLVADVAAAVWAAVARTLTAGTKDAEIDAIKAKTDNLPVAPASQGDVTSATATLAADIAAVPAATLDHTLAGHTTAVTVGGALAQLPPGGGARQITLRVVDGLAARVPGVSLAVYDATNTAQLRRGVTNASGELVVALDDGTYNIRADKALYSFTVPTVVVVTADAVASITATAFVPPSPVDPANCVIYDTLRNASGTPMVGIKVRFIASVPGVVGGAAAGNAGVDAFTNALGIFSAEFPYGTVVEVWCPEAGYRGTVKTVPSATSQRLSTW